MPKHPSFFSESGPSESEPSKKVPADSNEDNTDQMNRAMRIYLDMVDIAIAFPTAISDSNTIQMEGPKYALNVILSELAQIPIEIQQACTQKICGSIQERPEVQTVLLRLIQKLEQLNAREVSTQLSTEENPRP